MKQLHTNNKRLNTTFSTLYERFIKTHGTKYDYSKVVFDGMLKKVIITCPVHGDFEQIPMGHIKGKGCSECGRTKSDNNRQKFTKDEIIELSGKFNSTTEFRIKEPIAYRIANKRFGKEFLNNICKHMKNPSKLKTTEEFKSQIPKDYTLVSDYINSHTYVHLIHNTCGTNFKVRPYHLLNGSGCTYCSGSGGFSQEKPAILYLVKLKDLQNNLVYKIGITNLSVEKRYSKSERNKFISITTYQFEDGKLCYDTEQYFLKKYTMYRYQGIKLLKKGNTEILTHDIQQELKEYYDSIRKII